MKRLTDVVISSTALLILLPVMLCLAVLVRLKLGKPVLFRQERAGRYGRPFLLIKFRTMRQMLPGEDDMTGDAERLTPFGKWLRGTSLDELPELWNVVRGDLSLVGPRPLLMEYLPLYSREQMRRHDVPPGITGWAQVNGRNSLSWDDRFALDIWYVDNGSFWLDTRILLMTVKRVFQGDGINAAGHATMSKFTGSHVPDRM